MKAKERKSRPPVFVAQLAVQTLAPGPFEYYDVDWTTVTHRGRWDVAEVRKDRLDNFVTGEELRGNVAIICSNRTADRRTIRVSGATPMQRWRGSWAGAAAASVSRPCRSAARFCITPAAQGRSGGSSARATHARMARARAGACRAGAHQSQRARAWRPVHLSRDK